MPTLRVVCRVQYLSEPVGKMRPVDYDTTHLVKAIKGDDLHPKSYTWVKIGTQSIKIADANKDKAIDWFAEWAAPRIDALGHGDKVLVPVPGSKAVVHSSADFRTAEIARAIARKCRPQVTVAPIFRWDQPMQSSREGGPRDPHVLEAHIKAVAPVPPGKCVLVDDVLTSGGHLIACARKLRELGTEVELAICCGRSTHQQLPDPYTVADEHLELASLFD